MTLDLVEVISNMKNKFESLNDEFNVDNDIVQQTEIIKKEIGDIKTLSDDIKKDYDYTRGNLYSIIEKGQEAINGILEIEQESEMHRAYEVAGQLIKNVDDATDKLMELQKKLKDVEKSLRKDHQLLIMHSL